MFRAVLEPPPRSGPELRPIPVVAKICDPILIKSQTCGDVYSEAQARAAILTEDRVYQNLPLELIGKVVPRYYGLWGSLLPTKSRWRGGAVGFGRETWIMVLEDCGEEVGLNELVEADK